MELHSWTSLTRQNEFVGIDRENRALSGGGWNELVFTGLSSSVRWFQDYLHIEKYSQLHTRFIHFTG